MKKIFLTLTLVFAAMVATNAQNVAFISTEKVLESLKSYVDAQQELNALAEKYQASIQQDVDELDAIYREYQQNKAYYSQQQQTSRENYIIDREKAINEKQETYFGEKGVMAIRSESLLKPIKDRVQAAIDAVAARHGYVIILDTSVMPGVVYKNDKYDLTNEVIEYLK
ncbi:MAG: OmpH family outer membrane protein [Bacteroidales bacterium]|nr:OmpH family outer membrane protein [Bacteroidales bacterium]